MLKRITITTLTFVVALFASLAIADETAKSDKAPRLTVVDPVKDFGTVPKGEKLNWTFTVKNTGNADLEIIAAKPACGCTVAQFDKVIKPGETGKVVAAIDTTQFNGPISKPVTLETNDPSTPTAQVTITAIVKPYVEAYPAGFVRFNMLQGDVEKQSVVLYTEEQDPWEIVKVETPAEWIKVEHKKIDDPTQLAPNGRPGQSQYRIDVTVGGPDAKVGPLADKIRIVTNSKHQPEYLLSLSGVIRPRFRVDPMPTSGVNFGEVTVGDSASTRSIILRSNDLKTPETFQVTKIESSVPAISATVKPTANKGEYEVTLQIGKNAKSGEIKGEVKIHTNDKLEPVVTMPLRGTIKPASTTAASK
ncbi:MAG TPA: DUF1573 domain-containing protein [Thermoanaerobaculia bacterium]|nr:DUF1573 domain-containing protein [Thermoanaerobaculia bacterium]